MTTMFIDPSVYTIDPGLCILLFPVKEHTDKNMYGLMHVSRDSFSS